ncbi:MAG: LrgB family protein [Oscillospiraceae bacterium]|nr:LrgB family protein [Oscillospiraceae bacterium]
MNEFFGSTLFFGAVITIAFYECGILLKRKFKLALFNPLLICVVAIILFLVLTGTAYSVYYDGAKYISYLLTPATVCLAIPLYEQMELLKKNWKAVMAGILSGVLTSLTTVFALAALFHTGRALYVTLLPKSVTTAIGVGIAQELGGVVTITAAAIILTGIFGNMIAQTVYRVFHITEPIARGVGLGTAAHAIGTARAMEMGEVEGAMSSLSIAVAGVVTVVGASLFANLPV